MLSRAKAVRTFAPFILLWLSFGGISLAATPPLQFTPTASKFVAAAKEYHELWRAEGPRIIAALEGVTGLTFPNAPLEVFITEGPSMTAFGGSFIRLRASYPESYKRAVLVHELGHRLALVFKRSPHHDDHRILYLFLYDVWLDLYGQEFADRMVVLERQNSAAHYDYDAAWAWALRMTREQRQAELQALSDDQG